MRRIPRSLAGLAVAAALALASSACGARKPIVIGFIGELSGSNADIGEAGRNGVLLAVELANAAGGVDGRRFELAVRDDLSTAAGAVDAMRELAGLGVEVAIGPFNSAMADAALPEAEKAQLLLVSPTVSAYKYFGIDDALFRLNSTTKENAGAYAAYVASKLGLPAVAIAFDTRNRAFSESWADEFKAVYQAKGGEVASSIPFDASAEGGYGLAVSALAGSGSGCYVFVANAVDSARLAQLARKKDPRIHLVAAEWAATGQLIEMGGRDVEGMLQMQTYDAGSSAPEWVAFLAAFRERFRGDPSFAAVAAYDAAVVVMKAMATRARGSTAKEALLAGGPYQGLQQEIAFDRNGDTVRRQFFTVVRNGAYAAAE